MTALARGVVGLVLCLGCLSGTGAAQEEPADSHAVTRQIVELSGIKTLLMQLPGMMQAQQSQLATDLSPEFAAAVSDALVKGFEFDGLHHAVLGTFQDRFDADQASKALAWFKSPLAEKIRTLDLESMSPEAQGPLTRFTRQLASNPPPSQRLILIKRILQVTDTANFLTELDIAIFRGVATVMDQLRPPTRRLGPTKIEEIAESMRRDSSSRLEQDLVASILFTYRTLSDEELQRYLRFLETAEGQWFDKAFGDGMLHAVEQASARATQELLPLARQTLNN